VNALAALADPTRRRIVELLVEGERSAGELASQFRTARPGVSRHLRVLREHGLVRARTDGRRRVYSLDPRPLEELDAWLEHYRSFWTNRLDALETEIKRRRRKR
jgi:DNA-binding transcriptional ArsR family regulator